MAKSKHLVTWEDCMPAIWNGTTHDSLGVFSGSIVSRLVAGRRVLYLFYTSVSAVPIHWSKPYIEGCETQSVAISTDLGRTWVKDENNPLSISAPLGTATTGWRDPFVTQSASMSRLLNINLETNYMMISSGKRGHGPQLHLYKAQDLTSNSWKYVSTVLDVELRSPISPRSNLTWGVNFECASFFTIDNTDYILIGVEDTEENPRHCGRSLMWMSGDFVLDDHNLPTFHIRGHGFLDSGVLYAAHVFRDAENRLIQLGWADETAKNKVVQEQGWAGFLGHPRQLFEVVRPLDDSAELWPEWNIDRASGTMTTLGIRPAPQVETLRNLSLSGLSSLQAFKGIQSQNYEIQAKFSKLQGEEKFVFNVLQSPDSTELTQLIFDLKKHQIIVDRSKSSLKHLGATSPDAGDLRLLPGEDLVIRIFVDVSMVEIYANDRFALTSRVYPSLETSTTVSYDFGDFDEQNVEFECWQDLRNAWPARGCDDDLLRELHPLRRKVEWECPDKGNLVIVSEMPVEMAAAS